MRRLRADICGLVLLGLAWGGCEERVVGTRWGVIQPPTEVEEQQRTADPSRVRESGWAIALDRYDGEGHEARAQARRTQLIQQSGLPSVWVSNEGAQSLVFYGRYPSTQDTAAQGDLLRWRHMMATGRVQVPVVMLTPIVAVPVGSKPEFDLRNQRTRAIYTLQVAAFDESLPEFRKKAEEAAESLRKQGYEAYYFHGPNRTMVTIGLFEASDVSSSGESYSPRVQQIRAAFPYNTTNGLTPPAQGAKPQPSMLVSIPR